SVPPAAATSRSHRPRRTTGDQRRPTGTASACSRRIRACLLAGGGIGPVSATEKNPQSLVGPVSAYLEGTGRGSCTRRRRRHGQPLELQHLEGFSLCRRQPGKRLLEARAVGAPLSGTLGQHVDQHLAGRAYPATPKVVDQDVACDREQPWFEWPRWIVRVPRSMQSHQRVLEDILALMWIDDRLEEEASDRGGEVHQERTIGITVPALRALHPPRSLRAAGSKVRFRHSHYPFGGYAPARASLVPGQCRPDATGLGCSPFGPVSAGDGATDPALGAPCNRTRGGTNPLPIDTPARPRDGRGYDPNSAKEDTDEFQKHGDRQRRRRPVPHRCRHGTSRGEGRR